MKILNTLLLLVFCLLSNGLAAQQEARIMKLSRDIENVAKTSNLSSAERETRVINLLGNYLSDVKLKKPRPNSAKSNLVPKKEQGIRIGRALSKLNELESGGLSATQALRELSKYTDDVTLNHVRKMVDSSKRRLETNSTLEYNLSKSESRKVNNSTTSNSRMGPKRRCTKRAQVGMNTEYRQWFTRIFSCNTGDWSVWVYGKPKRCDCYHKE